MVFGHLIHAMVVAESPRARATVRHLLWPEQDITVAGEAANALEAVESMRMRPYDVVVLDLALPGDEGLTLLARLADEFSRVPAIGFADDGGAEIARAAERGGACRVIGKAALAKQLAASIRTIASRPWDRDASDAARRVQPAA